METTYVLFLSFPTPAYWVLVGLLSVLGVATIISLGMLATRPGDGAKEVWVRIRTWWVMIPLFMGMIGLADRMPAMPYIFFGFVSFIALKEYLSITPLRHSERGTFVLLYLAIPAQYVFASSMAYHGLFQMAILVYGMALIAIYTLINQRVDNFLGVLGLQFCALWIPIYSISHLAHFFALPAEANPVAGAVGLVLFVMLLTQGNDVAQFVSGKTFGQRKIIPLVSPNKTWEGFVGGVAITTAMATVIAPFLTPFSVLGAALLGLMIGVTGFFGDVFLSAIKRDMKVKDTSRFLPGHGGILDRIDSLTLTAPLYFHLVHYFIFMKGGWV